MQPSEVQRIARIFRDLQTARASLHVAQKSLLQAIEESRPRVDAERLLVAAQSEMVMAILADLQSTVASSQAVHVSGAH